MNKKQTSKSQQVLPVKVILMLQFFLFVFTAATADVVPCGDYEGTDKIDGLTRQAYLEINISDPSVPDFSQTFKKGEMYKFQVLPTTFMKKPSAYFKGQKANGFIRFHSKILIGNSEVCKLTNPVKTDEGWTLTWHSDMGKTGTCRLVVNTDGTMHFIGLGTFSKGINPDNLKLQKVNTPSTPKDYLKVSVPAGKPVSSLPGQPRTQDKGNKDMPAYTVEKDKAGNIKLPPANTGLIRGEWIGKNTDGSGIIISINSQQKVYKHSGTLYYGTIMMQGASYIEEGILRVKKIDNNAFAIYSCPLNTGNLSLNVSIVVLYNGAIKFYPKEGIEALTQMGRPAPLSQMIYCLPLKTQYKGKFTTGKEVSPFYLNFYYKDYYDSGYGDKELGYGCITTSFNMGRYTDSDFITEAEIMPNGHVKIKYTCGRTGNVYTAELVYSAGTKSYKPTQIKMKQDESDSPDSDDCYLHNAVIKLLGK